MARSSAQPFQTAASLDEQGLANGVSKEARMAGAATHEQYQAQAQCASAGQARSSTAGGMDEKGRGWLAAQVVTQLSLGAGADFVEGFWATLSAEFRHQVSSCRQHSCFSATQNCN